MDENFRKVISDKLNELGITKLTQETFTEEIEVEGERIDENDIGTASDGTKYVKSSVLNYLNENGYSLTQDSVDLAAKTFQIKGNSFIRKNIKTIVHSDFDNISDENIDTYLTLKMMELLLKIETQNNMMNLMDYTIDVIIDKKTGGTDFDTLINSINSHSQNGWKVKTVFTNECGKNSTSVTVGGYTSGTNATIDQVVVIYERPAFMTNKLANELRDKLK